MFTEKLRYIFLFKCAAFFFVNLKVQANLSVNTIRCYFLSWVLLMREVPAPAMLLAHAIAMSYTNNNINNNSIVMSQN